MRKLPVCSTQSSINGSRRACSASDSDRYALSTMRQYSRTSLTIKRGAAKWDQKHCRRTDLATLPPYFPCRQVIRCEVQQITLGDPQQMVVALLVLICPASKNQRRRDDSRRRSVFAIATRHGQETLAN